MGCCSNNNDGFIDCEDDVGEEADARVVGASIAGLMITDNDDAAGVTIVSFLGPDPDLDKESTSTCSLCLMSCCSCFMLSVGASLANNEEKMRSEQEQEDDDQNSNHRDSASRATHLPLLRPRSRHPCSMLA